MSRARAPRSRLGNRIAVLLTMALVLGGALFASAPDRAAAAVDDHDWLGAVNSYRMMSGLGPLTENPTWSAQGREHSRYMLLNDITHIQDPSKPGYTVGGALAGRNGNVAVSSAVDATPRRHVDLWMSGPFHAIGLLRENLTATGFGLAADADTSPWRSGATLDVIRGITGTHARTSAVVFPGHTSTIALHRFVAERPDPVALVGYSKPAGLPLFAMLPGKVTTATASLKGPDGPVETRVLHPRKSGGDETARQIMEGDNAVVIVPRSPLATGAYTASVVSDGGDVTWTFTIDPDADLPTPVFPTAPATGPVDAGPTAPAPAPPPADTTVLSPPTGYEPMTPTRVADSRAGLGVVRLTGGKPATIDIGATDAVAASVNITVDRPSAAGYLSIHGSSSGPSAVSALNFTDQASANHVVAPLVHGRLTLSASVDTDVIVDLNGVFRTEQTAEFVPVAPRRILDTRAPGSARVSPGEPRHVALVGTDAGTPVDATAVAVNIAVIEPTAAGFLTARPGGTAHTDVSNVNVLPGETRSNSALLAPGPDGTIVIETTMHAHVLVDVTGFVAAGTDDDPAAADGGLRFAPVDPIRLFDSRAVGELNHATAGAPVAADTTVVVPVAGHRGVPADARAVWVNVTAVDPGRAGFVTVFPGGALPSTSSLNTRPDRPAVANGVLVALHDGALSVYADHDVHVMVDLAGVWR